MHTQVRLLTSSTASVPRTQTAKRCTRRSTRPPPRRRRPAGPALVWSVGESTFGTTATNRRSASRTPSHLERRCRRTAGLAPPPWHRRLSLVRRRLRRCARTLSFTTQPSTAALTPGEVPSGSPCVASPAPWLERRSLSAARSPSREARLRTSSVIRLTRATAPRRTPSTSAQRTAARMRRYRALSARM